MKATRLAAAVTFQRVGQAARRVRRVAAPGLLAPLLIASAAHAQSCPGQWLPANPPLGFNGEVSAMIVLPGGDLVVGGSFTSAGGVAANHMARWNGVRWTPMGGGLEGPVWCLAVLPNGDIVAGGTFLSLGGAIVRNIARWDGAAWSAIGGGLFGTPQALAVTPAGDLIAAGYFGSYPDNVLRWTGSEWVRIGHQELFMGSVYSLAVLPGGDLVASGNFPGTGVEPMNTIRRWNGATWSAMQWGPYGGTILALLATPAGDLLAGGSFSFAGTSTANCVARRNGSDWAAVAGGMMPGPSPDWAGVFAFQVMPSGDLIAGGRFQTAGGIGAHNIARWNGSAWAPLGAGVISAAGPAIVRALAVLPDGDLAVGGSFAIAGGNPSAYWARWRDAPACYSNCDCSAEPPILNVADLVCFLGKFASADPYANCDGSTVPPTLNIADFICFQSRFAAGCP